MNTEAVIKVLRGAPGQTCAQIAAKLGEIPAFVSVALRELRAVGRVESAGNTRSTIWRIKRRKS